MKGVSKGVVVDRMPPGSQAITRHQVSSLATSGGVAAAAANSSATVGTGNRHHHHTNNTSIKKVEQPNRLVPGGKSSTSLSPPKPVKLAATGPQVAVMEQKDSVVSVSVPIPPAPKPFKKRYLAEQQLQQLQHNNGSSGSNSGTSSAANSKSATPTPPSSATPTPPPISASTSPGSGEVAADTARACEALLELSGRQQVVVENQRHCQSQPHQLASDSNSPPEGLLAGGGGGSGRSSGSRSPAEKDDDASSNNSIASKIELRKAVWRSVVETASKQKETVPEKTVEGESRVNKGTIRGQQIIDHIIENLLVKPSDGDPESAAKNGLNNNAENAVGAGGVAGTGSLGGASGLAGRGVSSEQAGSGGGSADNSDRIKASIYESLKNDLLKAKPSSVAGSKPGDLPFKHIVVGRSRGAGSKKASASPSATGSSDEAVSAVKAATAGTAVGIASKFSPQPSPRSASLSPPVATSPGGGVRVPTVEPSSSADILRLVSQSLAAPVSLGQSSVTITRTPRGANTSSAASLLQQQQIQQHHHQLSPKHHHNLSNSAQGLASLNILPTTSFQDAPLHHHQPQMHHTHTSTITLTTGSGASSAVGAGGSNHHPASSAVHLVNTTTGQQQLHHPPVTLSVSGAPQHIQHHQSGTTLLQPISGRKPEHHLHNTHTTTAMLRANKVLLTPAHNSQQHQTISSNNSATSAVIVSPQLLQYPPASNHHTTPSTTVASLRAAVASRDAGPDCGAVNLSMSAVRQQEEEDDDSRVNSGNASAGGGGRSGRSCKGKRYQEFIEDGRIAVGNSRKRRAHKSGGGGRGYESEEETALNLSTEATKPTGGSVTQQVQPVDLAANSGPGGNHWKKKQLRTANHLSLSDSGSSITATNGATGPVDWRGRKSNANTAVVATTASSVAVSNKPQTNLTTTDGSYAPARSRRRISGQIVTHTATSS